MLFGRQYALYHEARLPTAAEKSPPPKVAAQAFLAAVPERKATIVETAPATVMTKA
jgi:hypothetical protein